MLDTMGNVLVKSVVTDFGVQWVLFLIAAALKTEKFYDLAGSGTFFLLAYKSLQWGQSYFMRQKVQTGMVMIWAIRLGGYLVPRVIKDGQDSRFDDIRGSPVKFFAAWTMQGVWVFLTLLPTLMSNADREERSIGWREGAGWGLWVIGFLMEAMADHQKSAFRANPDNAGKFISTGLWSISRHPNYFGEILLWLGLYIAATPSLRGWKHVGAISPLFVTFLLTKISGVPMLEKSGLRRWGGDPGYQAYLRDTAVLIPFLW